MAVTEACLSARTIALLVVSQITMTRRRFIYVRKKGNDIDAKLFSDATQRLARKTPVRERREEGGRGVSCPHGQGRAAHGEGDSEGGEVRRLPLLRQARRGGGDQQRRRIAYQVGYNGMKILRRVQEYVCVVGNFFLQVV